MLHPYLIERLAAERVRQLLADADTARLVRYRRRRSCEAEGHGVVHCARSTDSGRPGTLASGIADMGSPTAGAVALHLVLVSATIAPQGHEDSRPPTWLDRLLFLPRLEDPHPRTAATETGRVAR